MGRLDPRAGVRGDARQDESPARCASNLRCAANQTEIRRKQFHVLTMGLPFPRRGQQIQCSFGDAIGAVATVAVPKERGDKGCEPSLRTLARFAATTFLVVFIASIFWSFFGRFFPFSRISLGRTGVSAVRPGSACHHAVVGRTTLECARRLLGSSQMRRRSCVTLFGLFSESKNV